MIFSFSHVTKSFLSKEVLRDITFHIEAKEKIALIGVNGAGKTTLFKIMAGEMAADSGEIFHQKNLKIGYLKQNQDYTSEKTIEASLLEVFNREIALEQKMHELEEEISRSSDHRLLTEYDKVQLQFDQSAGYAYRSLIRGILKGLGFKDEEYTLPVSSLSGGQRSRIALARLLLEKPDLMLLDEPTNHLDMNAIEWLENFIQSYDKACLIISHDRYFLDQLTKRTIEIENGVSTLYHGSYSFYVEEKKKRTAIALKQYELQQEEIRRQEEIIRDLRSRGREMFIKRAQSREKVLEKMDRLEKPVELNASMHLKLTPHILSGEDVLHIEDLSKHFGTNQLFDHVNLHIRRGEKVALLGANGIGKTTLLKMIMGQEHPSSGHITLGVKVFPGYYDQQQENLSPEKTVLDEIYDAFPQMTVPEVRNILGAFLFHGEDVFKPIRSLSGGEKARVSLCKIMLSETNFLLLDEPTNHLDIASREVLEDNLKSYEGTLFFISHDRYFINQIADRIVLLEPHGMTSYPGNYDAYLEHMALHQTIEENASHETVSRKPASSDFKAQKDKQHNITRQRTRLKRLEEEIAEQEAALERIEAQMLDSEYYSSAEKFHALEAEKAEANQALETAMEEWDELSDLLSDS